MSRIFFLRSPLFFVAACLILLAPLTVQGESTSEMTLLPSSFVYTQATPQVSQIEFSEDKNKQMLSFSALLKNQTFLEQTYAVGMEFVPLSDTSVTPFIVSFPEAIHFSGNEEKPFEWNFSVPTFLQGKYALRFGISDSEGNRVFFKNITEGEFASNEEVHFEQCSYGGSPLEKILVQDLNGGILSCAVSLLTGSPQKITLVAKLTDHRYLSLRNFSSAAFLVSEEGDEKTLSLTDSLAPGTYQLEIVALNSTFQPIGFFGRVPLTVSGQGGKLIALGVAPWKSDVDGRIVPVSVQAEFYDASQYRLVFQALSASDEAHCSEPISVQANNQKIEFSGELRVRSDCIQPRIAVTLFGDKGQSLDTIERIAVLSQETESGEIMKEESEYTSISWYQVAMRVFVALPVILLLFVLWRRKRFYGTFFPILFFLCAAALFAGSANVAKAGSADFLLFYLCYGSGGCPHATAVFMNVYTDKDVYAPGESIGLSVSIGSDDNPQGFCPVVVVRNNATGATTPDLIPDCYSAQGLRNGLWFNFPGALTAPNTAGPFSLSVYVGLNGYANPPTQNINLFTSAPLPVPTANIVAVGPVAFGEQGVGEKIISFFTGRDHVARASHQNTTITVGENARIDWSSSDASFCVVHGPGGQVASTLSGSQTLTGLSVGNHTYTLLCSGPGGNASHSATITVANTVCTENVGYAACSSMAGAHGIPPTYTDGTATYTQNSCTGVITYLGGCSAVTSVPLPALQICPSSAAMTTGSTQSFVAWFINQEDTFDGCTGGSPRSNVTASSSWSTTDASIVIVNGPGIATGVSAGAAAISVTYAGISAYVPINVINSCFPKTCTSPAVTSQLSSTCSNDNLALSDGCGGTITCTGTRSCGYNWREVAP